MPSKPAGAAREIAGLIEALGVQVRQGAEVSREAAQSFDGVLSSMQRTGTSVPAIARAAERQRRLANRVSKLIEDLAGMVALPPHVLPRGGLLVGTLSLQPPWVAEATAGQSLVLDGMALAGGGRRRRDRGVRGAAAA